MILEWHEEAKEEFAEAALYYERRVEHLGERFVVQVEATTARVLAAPLMPRCFDGECRKVRVGGFPYAVIYRVEEEDVLQIIAVAHLKRRPGYWKRRFKD